MKQKLLSLALLASSFTFAQSWNITGNSGTTSSSNFIGTTDAQDLVFKTGNLERMKILSLGSMGIGVEPDSRLALKVSGRANLVTDINSDAFYVGNDHLNIDNGASLIFLRYGKYQANNPGILDVVNGMKIF